MPTPNRQNVRAHALRLDRSSIVQGAIALLLAFLVAWLFNLR
ncbi:hypothetical protein [Gemmatimonas aurantiaca]